MANYSVNQDESLRGEPVQAQVVTVSPTPVVIPVPIQREVITDEMKKAYSYSYTIRWVSGIDMFFALSVNDSRESPVSPPLTPIVPKA